MVAAAPVLSGGRSRCRGCGSEAGGHPRAGACAGCSPRARRPAGEQGERGCQERRGLRRAPGQSLPDQPGGISMCWAGRSLRTQMLWGPAPRSPHIWEALVPSLAPRAPDDRTRSTWAFAADGASYCTYECSGSARHGSGPLCDRPVFLGVGWAAGTFRLGGQWEGLGGEWG